MGANHRLLHPNCCCEDCVHFLAGDDADEGFCHEAAEALAQEGWPKVTVSVEADMSAESCPSFEDKRAAYGPDEAADDAYRAWRDDRLCQKLSAGGAE